MTISFAPEAEADFAALMEYLAERNPSAAAALGNRIFEVIQRLADGAFDGVELTLTTGEVVRSWSIPPVRVYYQRLGEAFRVLRVYHQARSPISR